MRTFSIQSYACLSAILIVQSTTIFSQDLPCKSYYKEDGRCMERYKEDTQGKIHGTYIEYFPNGTRKKLATYKHGILEGEYEEYYSGGVKKGNYINGEKDGYWIDEIQWQSYYTYYETGYKYHYVYAKGKYTNGKKEGEWIIVEEVEKVKNRIIHERGKVILIPFKIIFSDDKPVRLLDSNGQDVSILVQNIGKKSNTDQQKEEINKDWERSYTIKDYESFINKYPSDSRVSEAKERIAFIHAWDGSIEAIDAYIKSYPFSDQIKEVQSLKKFVDSKSYPNIEETFEYSEDDFKNDIIGKTLLGNITIGGLNDQIINSKNLIKTIALTKINIAIKYKREEGKLVYAIVNDDKFFIYDNGTLTLFDGNNTYLFNQGKQLATVYYFGKYGYSIEDNKGVKIYESFKDAIRNGVSIEDTYKACGEELGDLFIISYLLHYGEENIIQEFPSFFISLNEYYLKNNALSKIDIEICYKLVDRLKSVGKEAWNSHSQLALIIYLKGEKEKALEVLKQRINQFYENKTIDSTGKQYYKDTLKSYLSEKVNQGVISKDIYKEIIKAVQ